MTSRTIPDRPDAHDRLRSLYSSPGPYVSFYCACGEFAVDEPMNIFDARRRSLATHGATERSLDAVGARLGLPVPDDVGGWAVLASADGSTAVDFAAEGPTIAVATVGALPMAAPLIEWDQWRIPHVIVAFGHETAEVVSFVPGAEPTLAPLPVDPATAAAALRVQALTLDLRLIVVSAAGDTSAELANRLRGIVPPSVRIAELETAASGALDELVDDTVRHVADVAARDTVAALEDFRFMASGQNAVEGSVPVFAALAAGRARRLLIHDDPNEAAVASFGSSPDQISADPDRFATPARRADVAIWSAVQRGIPVRIIPSTSSNGPAENIGATLAVDESSVPS